MVVNVLMSKSLIRSFVQAADSFRNDVKDEWAQQHTESYVCNIAWPKCLNTIAMCKINNNEH